MAWPEIARLLLRPEARRPEVWRGRWGWALAFSGAGIWSAIAPQATFSLGERLHLAFETMAGAVAVFALLTGIRYAPRNDPFVRQPGADTAVLLIRAANDLAAIAPFFFLLLALQSITPAEFALTVVAIGSALILSAAAGAFRAPILLASVLILAWLVMRRRSGFESILILLYTAHLYFKTHVAFAMANAMNSPNLAFEMLAPLNSAELAALRQKTFHARQIGLSALVILNLAALLTAPFWPLKLEDKLPLALILGFGILSLFLDTFALTWLAMRNHKPLLSLSIVLGVPWAVAWGFAALHTGEAFTLNEAAACFFLWAALGSTLSWLVGGAAKQKLLRHFREMAASPSPSEKVP